ncbi:MAG: outer membrane protein assembly factor BamE [Oscillospiraceae bacterium]|jgi:hypothetical protein|nr:outer membrane protein assembly factor BamE [Oscillospiraceae bacterium]
MKRKIAVVVLAVLIIGTFAACNANHAPPNLNTYIIGNPDDASGAGPLVSRAPIEVKDEEITVEEYEQITEGMSYEEVLAIVGGEGKPQKKRGPATPYQWVGFAPMSKTVTMNFNDDGKLISKDPLKSNLAAAQTNLPSPSAGATTSTESTGETTATDSAG